MTMTMNGNDYAHFLEGKRQLGNRHGFAPLWLPEFLFDFQAHLADWMLWRGRSAVLADCGMGKGPMALVWAENVARHTNGRVLILTPPAVAPQMVTEGEKFGVEVFHSRGGKFPSAAKIVTTNYEQLHYFDPNDFKGAVADESGCLKSFDSVRKGAVIEFLRTLPYRLLCTATAAPNDYVELGNHSEALGELGYMDMLGRFFKNDQNSIRPVIYRHKGRDFAALQEGAKWRFRGHAERDFWRWVCSWARAVRKPSDLGFPDGDFLLPPLETREHVVEAKIVKAGSLFESLALTRQEQLEVRRRTLPERCEKMAQLVFASWAAPSNISESPKRLEQWILWVHLNDEQQFLERVFKDRAFSIHGGMQDEDKERQLLGFIRGERPVLITKPSVAGFGLNLQNCCRMATFASHSFESLYQSIRRCWRYGQTRPVEVHIIVSEGEERVLENLRRKSLAADAMFKSLVELMNDSLEIERSNGFHGKIEVPSWL